MSANIWHPFTQHALAGPEIIIDRAEGAYLYTLDKRQIIDGISSWWVNTHGHCHPKIVAAVQKQATKLEQVIFAGFTHMPAQLLADGLLRITHDDFQHVFYSDSGSTSVEVALKMAIGYWQHSGKKRSKIVALEGGYHGDTFGAMAAGGPSAFSKIYEDYLFDVQHLPFDNMVASFEKLVKQGDVAVLILEPLVLAAGGMKFYTPETLKALADLCSKNDVLLIADEVMTGWGRTGTMFAYEQAGIKPDILCLSKGLTGGFLPMGATLCADKIYKAFYHKDRSKMFFHSSSYTGNALACAAALASLQIWEEEPIMERIQALAAIQQKAVARFEAREDLENVRALGTILAMDVKTDHAGYLSDLGPQLYDLFMKENVLLRPLGNTIYVMPPYCVSAQDMEQIYSVIEGALNKLCRTPKMAKIA